MVGTRVLMPTTEDKSTQEGEDHRRARRDVRETCIRRSNKGRPARLKLRAQALKGLCLVALNPQSDRELRSACQFGAAVSALENTYGNDLLRSTTTKMLRPA